MTEQIRSALRELQELDLGIRRAREKVQAYEPRILEVEEPARELERQVEHTRSRIQEMRVEERRLELSAREKKAREEKLEARLNQVRNVREEAAVNTELELVRRAMENEESEVLSMLDQIRRLELELEEQTDLWNEAHEDVGPRREALVSERDALLDELSAMEQAREEAAAAVDPAELKLYDAIRGDGGRAALAALTEDGACGNCFSIIPLQLQQEVLRGGTLIRCEGCGVILSPPLPEEEVEAEAEEPGNAEGSGDEGDAAADDGEETPQE
ncbi:MAG: hypothetical protein RQ745_14060 [Longimicrobiales bacterium]|nr:hypothetical protein [Longimicrobiales bacterium]